MHKLTYKLKKNQQQYNMKNLLIISAIIWAAVILLASYFCGDAENYQTLFGILIVAAGLHNSIIYNFLKKQKLEK